MSRPLKIFDKRTKQFRLRLTDNEYALLKAAAEHYDCSMSKYIMDCFMGTLDELPYPEFADICKMAENLTFPIVKEEGGEADG